MPLPTDRMPPTWRTLAEQVQRLRRDVNELRAARRIAAVVELEPWQDLILLSGWTAASGSAALPQYRRQVDGAVQALGSILPGTLTTGTVIANLDPAHRPELDIEGLVLWGGGPGVEVDVTVTAAGDITITGTSGTVTRVSLVGIRLPK